MRGVRPAAVIALLLLLPAGGPAADRPVVRVGSKSFTESYVLAEIVAQVVEQTGEARVERKLGLGGTGIVHAALASGEIDVYPEYTGTIARTILKEPAVTTVAAMRARLRERGLVVTEPLDRKSTRLNSSHL